MLMIKSKKFRKVLSAMLSVAMLGSTLVVGGQASAADGDLLTDKTVTGDATYISTYFASDYMGGGHTGFEVTFQYDTIGTPASDNTVGFNDTLEFLVFDSGWGGWNRTTVGPEGIDKTADVTPVKGKEYKVTVPFKTIEGKLTTGNQVQGINLQTGGIGDTQITIKSLKYVTSGTQTSQPVVLEGAWQKTGDKEGADFGSLSVTSGTAYVSANAWNVSVGGLNLSTFQKPIVAVTVEYGEVGDEPIYPQSEILKPDYTPVVEHYPQVTEAGEVTYLTNITKDMTSMYLAYDTCTVKKVEIYDEAESCETTVNNLTNANIISEMGAGWNLGNALESVNEQGETGETLWGNPVINKRLFKQVAAAGFKTVRIPTTWVNSVSVNGDNYTIDDAKFTATLDRLQEVVDMARDYDMFVIINIQHDGGEGVTGQWLDIDASNQTGIRAAFGEVWRRIAVRFKDYDQHLIFESMNEVMENGNYGTPWSSTTWTNINTLNQIFVDTVRGVGGNNLTRFLLVPGYNTNIDQTVKDDFVVPNYNGSTDRIMISAHFYDPYNFTLNTDTDNGSTTEISNRELANIGSQFNKLKEKFVDDGIPVVIGEFGAADKNNYDAINTYIARVVAQAKEKGLGYIYWDNGYTGEYGMGLWNRYTYAQTTLGKTIISTLTSAE